MHPAWALCPSSHSLIAPQQQNKHVLLPQPMTDERLGGFIFIFTFYFTFA